MDRAEADDEPARAVERPTTGFFAALSHQTRRQRLISRAGLVAGQRMATVLRDDHVYLILMAAVVGMASGAAAALFLTWLDAAGSLFAGFGSQGEGWLWIGLGLPVLGGLAVGLLHWAYARRGSSITGGIPGVAESVVRHHGHIRAREGVGAALGTGLTIGSGGAVGHEGPVAFVGATVGSIIARFFGLRLRRRILLVGAGCAGGVAAAFNAPLAGVIFTVEVVFGRSAGGAVGTMSVFTPLVVAAVTGTFVSHAIFGVRQEFVVDAVIRESPAEIGSYLLLALVAGLLGPVSSRLVLRAQKLFAPVPLLVRPALGGLLLGLLAALTHSEILFSGRESIDDALGGNLTWHVALQLAALKLLAMAITVGSGGLGGVLMPSLFVGACLGSAIHGILVTPLFAVETSSTTAFALVGMGASMAAVFRSPLTPIVMVFELTHDYEIILPLMTACILASFVAGKVDRESLLQSILSQRGVHAEPETHEVEVMKRGHVSELLRRHELLLSEQAELARVQELLVAGNQPVVFLLDDAGKITRQIQHADFVSKVVSGELDERHLHHAAVDIATSFEGTTMVPEDTLAGALWAFDSAACEVLPVVDRQGVAVGVLRRADVVSYYTSRVLSSREDELHIRGGASPVRELGLGAGVILERVVVGRGWAGRTLAQLDLRGRAEVQVIEWSRAETLLAIDPHAPLAEADTLALLGTRTAILAARRLR